MNHDERIGGSYRPVWIADLSSESLELCLLDARGYAAQHVSLRASRDAWTEKVAEIGAEVGRLDVLTIGAQHPEVDLAPIKDSVNEVRPLRSVVAWPMEQEVVRGTSTAGAVDSGPSELPGEHRLAAISARLYELRTLRESAEVLLMSLWGGVLCVDRISVAAGREPWATFRPLFAKRLRDEELVPNHWKRDLWAELLSDPRVIRVLETGTRYSVSIPSSANARLPLQWPGNCAGCDFGALEGMAALWLLKHGRW